MDSQGKISRNVDAIFLEDGKCTDEITIELKQLFRLFLSITSPQ